MSLSQVSNLNVVTIEGLSETGLHPVQQAWIDEEVPQCGYCQSGQIMAAVALLETKSTPSDKDINAVMKNICLTPKYAKPPIRSPWNAPVNENLFASRFY